MKLIEILTPAVGTVVLWLIMVLLWLRDKVKGGSSSCISKVVVWSYNNYCYYLRTATTAGARLQVAILYRYYLHELLCT